jgi:hypothetical protein
MLRLSILYIKKRIIAAFIAVGFLLVFTSVPLLHNHPHLLVDPDCPAFILQVCLISLIFFISPFKFSNLPLVGHQNGKLLQLPTTTGRYFSYLNKAPPLK